MSRKPLTLFHQSVLIGLDCFSMMIHCNSKEAINKERMARNGMVTDVSHITEQRSIILYFHMPYLVGR